MAKVANSDDDPFGCAVTLALSFMMIPLLIAIDAYILSWCWGWTGMSAAMGFAPTLWQWAIIMTFVRYMRSTNHKTDDTEYDTFAELFLLGVAAAVIHRVFFIVILWAIVLIGGTA